MAKLSCAVCKLSDARGLVVVRLGRDDRGVTLCGTHAVIYERSGARAKSVEELAAIVRDRRARVRRAREHDELASMLSDAFSGERRRRERRAS